MAKNIKGRLSLDTKSHIISIMGGKHAQRSVFTFNNQEHIPCALHLMEIAEFIGIQYNSGTFYNFGVRKFSKPKIPDKNEYHILHIIDQAHNVTPLFNFDTKEYDRYYDN